MCGFLNFSNQCRCGLHWSKLEYFRFELSRILQQNWFSAQSWHFEMLFTFATITKRERLFLLNRHQTDCAMCLSIELPKQHSCTRFSYKMFWQQTQAGYVFILIFVRNLFIRFDQLFWSNLPIDKLWKNVVLIIL